jgi:hypothetical protein
MRIKIENWLFTVALLLASCVRTTPSILETTISPCTTPRATPPLRPDEVTTSAPDSTPSTTPSQPDHHPTISAQNTEPVVARAIADLAARLDVDVNTVEVISIRADEFPIQNLGCPSTKGKEPEPVQPAFVTGREITLAVGDRRYTYRTHGGMLVFCEQKP